MKFLDYLADTTLIQQARQIAETLLKEDPELNNHPELLEIVQSGELISG